MDPSPAPSGSNGMPPLAQPPPPAPTSDSGTQYSGSGRPIPRVSGAGAPLTGGYNPQKVYIGNLPETATLADLEDCFGAIGQCTCSIKRGFGFVEYLDSACAVEAVAKYHEGHFLGAQIKVELSHQRAPVARPDEGTRFPSRNPPGSDRPSDSRKPMHINGPPGQSRGRNHPRQGGPGPGPYSGRPDQFAPQGGPGFANNRFGGPPPRDGPFPPRGGPPFPPRGGPPFPPRGGDGPYSGPPGPDHYRDDFRGGHPPPAPYGGDSRYGGGRDYDSGYGAPPSSRDARGPAPPLGGNGYASALPPRDARPPFDPYYDAPRGNGYAPYPVGGRPPIDAPPPPVSGYAPLPPNGYPGAAPLPARDPYAMDRYGEARPPSIPPAFDAPRNSLEPPRPPYDPYDSRGPLGSNVNGGADRYDPRGGPAGLPPRGDDRSGRYNPYARPESTRNGAPDPYSAGSPPRGGRRSLSPRRDDPYRAAPPMSGYGALPPPPANGGYAPYDSGYNAPRYGAPPGDEPYNPRR